MPVAPGQTFSLDVWALAGEPVAGLSYKVRTDAPDSAFVLTGVDRSSSPFDFSASIFSGPEPLAPSNESDLGAVVSDPAASFAGGIFIARLDFAVAPGAAPGDFVIGPDPAWSVWVAPESGDEFEFEGLIAARVTVIPEPARAPTAGAALLAIGAIVTAARRRHFSSRGNHAQRQLGCNGMSPRASSSS